MLSISGAEDTPCGIHKLKVFNSFFCLDDSLQNGLQFIRKTQTDLIRMGLCQQTNNHLAAMHQFVLQIMMREVKHCDSHHQNDGKEKSNEEPDFEAQTLISKHNAGSFYRTGRLSMIEQKVAK